MRSRKESSLKHYMGLCTLKFWYASSVKQGIVNTYFKLCDMIVEKGWNWEYHLMKDSKRKQERKNKCQKQERRHSDTWIIGMENDISRFSKKMSHQEK